jgi:glucose-1-phosphate thymidylyltransferase
MEIDTAVVLAAGEGTRLRPLTRHRPKPMLPAANRPILEHVFDAIVAAGIERIVTVVGYKRDRVQNHFGPEYNGVPITYVTQQKQLGSGHALAQARSEIEDATLVLNGDRLVDSGTVSAVADRYAETGDPSMAVIEQRDTSRYGAVELHGGDIETLVEKPRDGDYHLINGGVYAFSTAIFDDLESTPRVAGELRLTDTLESLIERERVRAVEVDGMWVDATYPWDLLTVAREVVSRGRLAEPVHEEGIWIDESARVHESAVIQPPTVIGPDCEIDAGVVLGPETAIGSNVTIGSNTVVRQSVIDDDTRIAAGSTIIDTVTGQSVKLGAGTVVPSGPSEVQVGTTVYENQRLGAVIADRAHAHGSVSITPGSLIGPNAKLGVGVTVDGNVTEDTEVTR